MLDPWPDTPRVTGSPQTRSDGIAAWAKGVQKSREAEERRPPTPRRIHHSRRPRIAGYSGAMAEESTTPDLAELARA